MSSVCDRVLENNVEVYARMKPGDCIEFPRGLYSHWAICVGGGQLVHLSGDNDGMGNLFNVSNASLAASGELLTKAQVCCEDFWDVVGNSCARIDNRRKTGRLPASEIVRRAKEKIGKVGYNLIYNNCEHFVNWCCYDEAYSKQVDDTITGVAVGAGVLAVIGISAAIAKSLSRPRKNSE